MFRKLACGSLFLLLGACGAADEGSSDDELGEENNSPVVVASVTDGTYVIRSVATNKCLDVSGSSMADGAKVQEWTCNGTNAQKFQITNVGGNDFKIVNINSNKAIDVKDASTAVNTPIQQWSYLGGQNQKFYFVNRGGNDISIHARHTNMVLDLAWGDAADGTAILQYPYQGGSNQKWSFDKVSSGGGGGSGPRFSGFTSYNFYDGVPATSTRCNLDPASFQYQVTALRTDLQNQLNACGKCARVTSKPQGGGNGNTVVVHIIDNSNDYSSNGGQRLLDMAPQAYDQIGSRDPGSIPVDFEVIDCP